MNPLEAQMVNLTGKNIIITGDILSHTEFIQQYAKKNSVLCMTYKESSFKIDTAAQVRSYCQNAQEDKTILIITALHITEEAEASLLKTLEERDEKITICICVPSTASLEKTILSRSVVVHGEEVSDEFAEIFLKTGQTKRMLLPHVTQLLDSEDEFAKMKILLLLTSAYKISLQNAPDALPKETYRELLTLIEEAAKPGSSLKQVVQTAALLIPQI